MVWQSQLAFWSMQVGLSVQAMLTCRHFWCNRCMMHGLWYHQFYTSFEGKLCICSHVYSTRYGQAVWGNACVHKSYLLLVRKRCCTFYAQLRHTILHKYWALVVIILLLSLSLLLLSLPLFTLPPTSNHSPTPRTCTPTQSLPLPHVWHLQDSYYPQVRITPKLDSMVNSQWIVLDRDTWS